MQFDAFYEKHYIFVSEAKEFMHLDNNKKETPGLMNIILTAIKVIA